MPDGLLDKLAKSLQEPVSLFLLLGVVVFYRLYTAERAERQDVQGKSDRISTLYHEQGKALMVLLENIKEKLK